MADTPDAAATLAAAYATEGAAIDLGRAVHEGALLDAAIRVPLATMNRHGLVAGATGTGKTKTLQLLAEQLSTAGVPVLVADVKGDVSGLAHPAEPGGAGEKRMAELGLPFTPTAFPVEFLSLGGLGPGVPVRATVSDFGPQLLAKVLEANETQESSLGLVFHYADTKGLPLLDLSDLRALLTFLDSDAGKPELEVLFTRDGLLTSDQMAESAKRYLAGEPPDAYIADDVVDALCIAGTEADCRRALQTYADLGVGEVSLFGLSMEPESQQMLERLARSLEREPIHGTPGGSR